jgi:hypothetical protein
MLQHITEGGHIFNSALFGGKWGGADCPDLVRDTVKQTLEGFARIPAIS